MKKQLTQTIAKKASLLILAVVILFGAAPASYAQTENNISLKGVEITYQGLQNKKLLFNINYKNEVAEPFELIIKNEQNEIIFFQKYNAQPLNRSILFSEVNDNCKITFLIKTGKKELAQAFKINTEVKTSEEYLVKGI